VGAERPAGGLLGAAACVGATVEAPARGALVDLTRPLGDRLAQAVGVAAGVLHLVRERGPVDPPVRQSAGRQPGPARMPELTRPLVSRRSVGEHLLEVDVLVELLELPVSRGRDRLLQRIGERPCSRRATTVDAVSFAGVDLSPAFTGSCGLAGRAGARLRVGLADDSPVLAGGVVKAVDLAVGDPDHLRVEVVERAEVVPAEHGAPHRAERVERGRLNDPVVSAGPQVDARASGEIARHRQAGDRGAHYLLGERGQDHVGHGCLKGAADEPAAERVGRKLADTVGLHPRLFKQPPVDGELPVVRVVGLRQHDVVLDRPPLGVLGMERLVQCDPEAAKDRRLLEYPGGDRLAGTEQRLGVEVDGAGVDLDVAGVRQPRADQRPHRIQPLQHERPVV
jgi:hypothetical protein